MNTKMLRTMLVGVVALAGVACNPKGACVMGAGTEFEACSEEIGKSACEDGKGQTFHKGALCVGLGYTTEQTPGTWVKTKAKSK